MAGFSKLFSSLLDSSVWRESMPTRIVWITMLAACDYDGYVDLSPHGLAHRAKVTLDEAVAAIVVLSSPDAESRTKDNEGRRIEVLDEGFVILNYAKYRERAQAKEGGRAPYYRAWRARRRAAAFKDDEGEER